MPEWEFSRDAVLEIAALGALLFILFVWVRFSVIWLYRNYIAPRPPEDGSQRVG